MSSPLAMQSTLNFRQTAGSGISDSVPDGQSVDAANLSAAAISGAAVATPQVSTLLTLFAAFLPIM